MSLSINVSGAAKDQLVLSLSALVLSDSGIDISADNLSAVAKATGNTTSAYFPALFATLIEKSGGVDKFLAGPSAGGSAPASAAAAPAAAGKPAAVAEKPKVEEVDALDGGMDMFGGASGGKDY